MQLAFSESEELRDSISLFTCVFPYDLIITHLPVRGSECIGKPDPMTRKIHTGSSDIFDQHLSIEIEERTRDAILLFHSWVFKSTTFLWSTFHYLRKRVRAGRNAVFHRRCTSPNQRTDSTWLEFSLPIEPYRCLSSDLMVTRKRILFGMDAGRPWFECRCENFTYARCSDEHFITRHP